MLEKFTFNIEDTNYVASFSPVPAWMSEEAIKTLNQGYLLPGECPRDLYYRVACQSARILNRPELMRDLFDILYKGFLGLATPVASNFGANRGLPISCFGANLSDNIPSIYSHLKEGAMMSKNGGGVAFSYSNIRGAGAAITGGGISTGIVPIVQQYDKCAGYVSQGACYSSDTEVLTNKGWKLFKDLEKQVDLVGQINKETNLLEFVLPLDYIEQPAPEKMIRFKTDKSLNIDLLVTPNHKMVYFRRDRKGEYLLREAEQHTYHRDNYIYQSIPIGSNLKNRLSDKEKLLIAYQADGSTNKSGNSNLSNIYQFHFSKQRKIERFEKILLSLNLRFDKKTYNNEKSFNYLVWFPLDYSLDKDFNWVKNLNPSLEWCKEFIEEVALWDGSYGSKNSIKYSNTNKNACDIVQYISTLCGYRSNLSFKIRENKQDIGYVAINKATNTLGGESISKTEVLNYTDNVYCVEVPSNILVVRRNGQVSICGNTRRGSFAHYLSIEHTDAYELLLSKDHLNGDPRKMIDGNIAFTITDSFMKKVLSGNKEASRIFGKALETNLKTGSPYFFFIDNVNRANPQAYINHNLKVESSNLCSEITLFTDEGHSFVCCLSSLNLARWNEWKDWKGTNTKKSVVELSIYLLDSVIEEFIKRAKNMVGMGRSVRSAEKGRALGLGSMGLAYLYQLNNLPFKSLEARTLNIEIHQHIQQEAIKASKDLALEYGEPEWCKGTGMRNTHLTACAPTRTNSVISGAFSAGIEPIDSNAYTAKQAKGSFTRKNPLLQKLLQEKGIDTPETWEHILNNNGSVLYLDSLSINEKLVFLTAREIDQEELIRQASDRTPYICQAQSLNRFVHPNIPLKQLSELVFKAWKGGVKSTYYTKSSSEQVLSKVKNKATIISKDNCPYCDKAKQLFKELNIEYTEYSRKDVEYFPWKTVPQIWYEGHFIGGYSELLEYTETLKKDVNLLSNNKIQYDITNKIVIEDTLNVDCPNCEG